MTARPHASPALLLFDIDGTLLRTNGAGMRAMARVGERLFGDGFRLDGVQAAGHLDTLIFAEATAHAALDDSAAHEDRFRAYYIDELRCELQISRADVRAMPGVAAALALLRRRELDQRDVVLGLLTGNYASAVPVKLAPVGIDPAWFGITAFAEDAVDRPGLVAVALARYESRFGRPAPRRKVVIIGDTPRDVNAARVHGCVSLAVATGGYSVDQLRAAGADVAVENLSDLSPLLATLAN